jgi:general secretion pathway protein B
MSYILDALKRAEAERDRGAVPTLSTQSPAPGAASGAGRVLRPVLIGAAMLLLMLLGAGVTRWLTAPKPAVMAQPAALPPAPLPPPVQVQPVPQAAPPARAEAQRPPAALPAPLSRAPAASASMAPALAAPVAPVAAPVAAPVVAQAAPVAMADLPEATRRELPAIKAGGAMVSDVPANRMLIINGQLLHEGEAVAPGLLLETIGLRSAVLSYKGQRFTINY